MARARRKRTTPADASPLSARVLVSISLTALIARLVHIWQMRPSPFFELLMGDSKAYDAWAQRLAAGDWIGTDVFYQAPLYPYFLGVIYTLFGHDLLAVRIVQAVLGSSACVLLALAGARLFTPRIGTIAGFALAVYAPAIFFDGLLQKASLDLVLTCLVLWLVAGLLDRPSPAGWIALGVAMGTMSLNRENAMVFVAVLGAWALTQRVVSDRQSLQEPTPLRPTRTGFAAAALFGVGLTLILLPVAVRNNIVSGGFYLTTSQFGPNFYLGNNPVTDGTAGALRQGRGAAEYERTDAIALAEAAAGRRLSAGEVSSFWTERALDFITSQPGAWLRLMARKFALLWNRTEMLDTESQESHAEWSWPLRLSGWFSHFGVVVPLALAGVILSWPDRRRLWVLYAMTGAYAFSVIIFFIYARYRYPLVPFLLVFAAAPVAWIARALGWWEDSEQGHAAPAAIRPFDAAQGRPERAEGRARGHVNPSARIGVSSRWGWGPSASEDQRAVARVTLVLMAAAVFTNWPVLSADLMKAITDHNVGAELQSRGRLDEAIDHYRRAAAHKPDYAPAYNNLGTALAAKGDRAGAIEQYRRALAIQPGYDNAHYNLANALLADGEPDQAIEHFTRSLANSPPSADVYNNLGIALAESGRVNEAIDAMQTALRFDPNRPETHRNLARLYLNRRDFTAAAAAFREVVRLQPESAEAHNDLGVVLAAAGDREGAIAAFERAVALQPGFVEAQRNLAGVRGTVASR